MDDEGVIYMTQDSVYSDALGVALKHGVDVQLEGGPDLALNFDLEDGRWRIIGVITRDAEGFHALRSGGSVRDLLTLCMAAGVAMSGRVRTGLVVNRVSGSVQEMWAVLVPWAEDLMGEP